jgi:hypothetical protein
MNYRSFDSCLAGLLQIFTLLCKVSPSIHKDFKTLPLHEPTTGLISVGVAYNPLNQFQADGHGSNG